MLLLCPQPCSLPLDSNLAIAIWARCQAQRFPAVIIGSARQRGVLLASWPSRAVAGPTRFQSCLGGSALDEGFEHKLQALVKDILPPTTVITGYSIGPSKLQALVCHILLPTTAITGYSVGV